MVKRSFSEYDPNGLADVGPAAKAPTVGNSFAMKFLFSEAEMRAIGQNGEEIQRMTSATLATTGELYPATTFQELNIAGPNTESVLSAAVYALAQIVQVEGAVTSGEEGVPHGEGRLRTLVPTKAAAAVIGRGGASIAQIRAATKLHVHVDKVQVPPHGGPLSEQVVSLAGPLVGLQDGLAMILEHVHATIAEPWFAAWASSTNVGLEFPGLALELSGKGMKGGGKGGKGFEQGFEQGFGGKGGKPANITADSSLGVSGELCQFFARSGWCRWGDACKHIHSGGPAVPINPSLQSAFPSGSVGGGAVGEVCEFFAKAGWCKFGDACRFVHAGGGPAAGSVGGSRPSAVSILNAFGVRSEGSAASFSTFPSKPPGQSGEICRFFQKAGWCQRGDTCWHVHTGGPAGVAGGAGGPSGVAGGITPNPGEVCAFFQRTGQCKFGAACRYVHNNIMGDQSGGQPAVQSKFDLSGFSAAFKSEVFEAPQPVEDLDSLCNQYLE